MTNMNDLDPASLERARTRLGDRGVDAAIWTRVIDQTWDGQKAIPAKMIARPVTRWGSNQFDANSKPLHARASALARGLLRDFCLRFRIRVA